MRLQGGEAQNVFWEWEETLTQDELDFLNWGGKEVLEWQSKKAIKIIDGLKVKWWILPDTLEWAMSMADELDGRVWRNKIKLWVNLMPHLNEHLEKHKKQDKLLGTLRQIWEKKAWSLWFETEAHLEGTIANLTSKEREIAEHKLIQNWNT